MENQQTRSRAVTWALEITENTSLAPSPYERHLLDEYVRGTLSIDEVIELLEDPSQSQGTQHPLELAERR